MALFPDPNKQATKVLLCRKINFDDHPKSIFNGNHVQ